MVTAKTKKRENTDPEVKRAGKTVRTHDDITTACYNP